MRAIALFSLHKTVIWFFLFSSKFHKSCHKSWSIWWCISSLDQSLFHCVIRTVTRWLQSCCYCCYCSWMDGELRCHLGKTAIPMYVRSVLEKLVTHSHPFNFNLERGQWWRKSKDSATHKYTNWCLRNGFIFEIWWLIEDHHQTATRMMMMVLRMTMDDLRWDLVGHLIG